jgi:MFS family permease
LASTTAPLPSAASAPYEYKIPFVIAASSAGTTIEWYDFYLYAVLTPFLAPLFFPSADPTASLLAGLAAFGAGFAVRPFGAVVFGRIGDIIGRKFTFLLTITLMGIATTIIGLLPTYAQIGILAPILLVGLRLLQGLALGGEYGGAAIYVAEHAPDHKRGLYTSWIQTTATVGLLMALIVLAVTRLSLGEQAFRDFGFRIPFILSAFLVILAIYIRLRLRETPLFTRLKDAGKTSTSPLREALGNRANLKLVVLALIGMTAAQGVVWYQGQFQALFFLQNVLGVGFTTAYLVVGVAIVLATPFFIVFGRLSDRIGRKKVILGGALIAAISYFPIYNLMFSVANPVVNPKDNPAITSTFISTAPNIPMLIALVWIQIIFVTMVYGPIAAFLVEFFPARIRYTSLSVPYHFGNGWFGGFLPLIAASLSAATGNIYAGLIYPIAVALIGVVVGGLFIRETKDTRIWDEVGGEAAPERMPGAVTEATPG